MKLGIVVSFAVAGFLFGFAQRTLACSCDLPARDMSVKQQVKHAKKKSAAVFSGEVYDVRVDGFSRTVKIKVISKWKGIEDSEAIIHTGGGKGDCGYNFEIGQTYLIYAYKSSNGRLSTNICQRTNLLSKSQEDIAVLRKK